MNAGAAKKSLKYLSYLTLMIITIELDRSDADDRINIFFLNSINSIKFYSSFTSNITTRDLKYFNLTENHNQEEKKK